MDVADIVHRELWCNREAKRKCDRILYLCSSTIFEKKLSSGKRGAGLDSPFATLLLIALPDFVIAVVVVIVVGCHSKHSFDSMV
jgi:hypothetical protein